MISTTPSTPFSPTVEDAPTGLTGTLGIQIINAATQAVAVARTTAGIVEYPAGSGIYTTTVTSPAIQGDYTILWDTNANPAALGYAAATEELVVASYTPVGTGVVVDDFDIVAGDDYLASDDRAFVWDEPTTGWPVLTSATIGLHITRPTRRSPYATVSGTVVTATGYPKRIRVQMTAAATDVLSVGEQPYSIVATLPSSHLVTLARGFVTVAPGP